MTMFAFEKKNKTNFVRVLIAIKTNLTSFPEESWFNAGVESSGYFEAARSLILDK